MGCTTSGEKLSSEQNEKLESFERRLGRLEPLAIHLRNSFKEFLQSCDEFGKGNVENVTYNEMIHVNGNVPEANTVNLFYDTAKDTASEFLAYAMIELGKKNWGGQLRTHLHGISGGPSDLVICGKVEFDSSTKVIIHPVNMTFKFYCAEES